MIDTAILHGLGLAPGARPLTGTPPACLATLGAIALIDHALDRLAAQGVARVVAPCHHARAAIAAHCAARGAARGAACPLARRPSARRPVVGAGRGGSRRALGATRPTAS